MSAKKVVIRKSENAVYRSNGSGGWKALTIEKHPETWITKDVQTWDCDDKHGLVRLQRLAEAGDWNDQIDNAIKYLRSLKVKPEIKVRNV